MNYSLGKARLNYSDEGGVTLSLNAGSAISKEQELDVTVDVGESMLPVSIELLWAEDQLEKTRMDSLLSALRRNEIKYAFDRESDALIVNLNAIEEDPKNQRPYTAKLLFDATDNLIAIELRKRVARNPQQ